MVQKEYLDQNYGSSLRLHNAHEGFWQLQGTEAGLGGIIEEKNISNQIRNGVCSALGN
jgi:hypothetical protein